MAREKRSGTDLTSRWRIRGLYFTSRLLRVFSKTYMFYFAPHNYAAHHIKAAAPSTTAVHTKRIRERCVPHHKARARSLSPYTHVIYTCLTCHLSSSNSAPIRPPVRPESGQSKDRHCGVFVLEGTGMPRQETDLVHGHIARRRPHPSPLVDAMSTLRRCLYSGSGKI